MLKRIGMYARQDMERTLDTKINLKLWVKVRKDWDDNEQYLSQFKNKIS